MLLGVCLTFQKLTRFIAETIIIVNGRINSGPQFLEGEGGQGG